MRNTLIAQRYAKAFLRNFSPESYDLLLEDIRMIFRVFVQDPEIAKTINSFMFTPQERLKLANQVLDNLNEQDQVMWRNLFKLLIQKHKFKIIFEITSEMENMILAGRGQVKMLLTVAHELPESTLNKINEKVSGILNKEIIPEVIVDPSIVGGFVAEAESIRIDGSIKHNLIKFQNLHLKNNTRSI